MLSTAIRAISLPFQPKHQGLTPKEVAKNMIKQLLTFLDIPATICSDSAPQFTSGWLKAMCAYMGVRHRTSVAHLSSLNRRTKVAGRQVFERLHKRHLENPKENWFREMWRAIQAYNDLPGPYVLSPHEILLTRDGLIRSLPWYTGGLAKNAMEAFQ